MQVSAFNPREDSRNIDHYRRENSFWQEWSLFDLDTGKQIISARFYGSAATVYCVVWIWNDAPCRGYGKAGGYGYHKQSAALQEALSAAGVTLSENIGGVGETAMRAAFNALAAALRITRPMIHVAHA